MLALTTCCVAACLGCQSSLEPPQRGGREGRSYSWVRLSGRFLTLFTAEERIEMIRAEVKDLPVQVEYFRGLVVEHARGQGISVILRGVRTVSDFEYEYQMAMTNRTLEPSIETAFVMPSEKYSYLSSRLIKEVYASGGELRTFLPDAVHNQLLERLGRNRP